MKNHKMVNGKLLQTNKKWSHLKMRQREEIYNYFKEEYKKFFKENNKVPTKEDRRIILDKVYSLIEDREIWIPYNEVKRFFSSKIIKLNKMLLKNN